MNNITVLKSKIHRATVTEANLDYVGSITIDPVLMEAANIHEYEQVLIANITNGNRLETYALIGERGSGEICINGAAAHLVGVDDLVIIITFRIIEEDDVENYPPRIILVDEKNIITSLTPEAV